MESVKEFYANRSIFLTGATGFVGKVLIEKLLRSCPKINKIYILIRPKKGKTPEERVEAITSIPLFDKLKEKYPNAIKDKLIPVVGDAIELGLGLSKYDADLLIENVSIIFHGAASVRFDDPLKYAILLNTRGTREMINLALKMKKLEVLLHVSTTYCNSDHDEVTEQLYPPHADWRKSIQIAETIDEHYLQLLTTKYIDTLPNTYTFSKSLAEHCVYDMCKGNIPAVICRPSIVISSLADPIPGWIDNFNGPVGLLVASGKGILRSICTNPDVKADYISVDTCVRGFILAAWNKVKTIDTEKKLDVSFYNCSNNGLHTVTMKKLIDLGIQIYWEVPISNIMWFPGGSITTNRFWYYLNVIFLHLLPAVFIDSILKLLKKKPILVKIQRRIYIANMAMYPFITRQWSFPHNNALTLQDGLLPEEKEEFGFDPYNVNIYEYFFNCLKYGRKYLMKEDDSTLESAKVNLFRMYMLDRVARFMVIIVVLWYWIFKFNLLGYLAHKLIQIYEALLI